jgi:hypothetical protein
MTSMMSDAALRGCPEGRGRALKGTQKGKIDMPENIEEIKDELLVAVLDAHIEVAAKEGYQQGNNRDAIAEAMRRQPELFEKARQAKGFDDISRVALWLEAEMANST